MSHYPTVVHGHPVPIDPSTGLPDENSLVGMAARILGDCDVDDFEGAGAPGDTVRVAVAPAVLRRLVAAALAHHVPAPRFEVRKDAVHPWWGVFDTQANTWHEGDYPDTLSAARIPMWASRKAATRVMESLNDLRPAPATLTEEP